MGVRVGLDCKLYRNTGTYGSPVWNEVTIAQDVALNLDKDMAEAVSRASRWKQMLAAFKSATIDLGLLADPSADDWVALRDAYINDTVLDLAMADGAIATTGTQYFRADHYVTAFPIKEPLANARTVEAKTALAYSSNPPAFTAVP